jgi:hypothetical protein
MFDQEDVVPDDHLKEAKYRANVQLRKGIAMTRSHFVQRATILLTGLTLAALLTAAGHASAREIGFIEDFALAKDRAAALKQLIPGTEDYYYYHSLHYQHTEQFAKVDDLMKLWIKRYGYTTRVWEIKNRQALLTYDKNAAASLEHIRQRLGISFNHQRESLTKVANLPITLNQNRISRATLTKIAMSRYSNLNGFENSALDWLTAVNLDPNRRRILLQRLQRPDYANLPKLVVDDLNHKYSRGFGSFNIHRQLLLTQLEASLKLKPDLLNQTNFVYTYLSKLHPNPDVDWQHNAKAKEAYLDRMWAFVSRLAPVHNSLKAHVLYQRLLFDRSRGVYDKARFMTYIKLPRRASYVEPKFLTRTESRKYPVNLNANYQSYTRFPIVGSDELLIRSYLHHFFIKETTYKPYTDYIRDTYLKHHLAETKIVNGLGDPEQWYSMMSPSAYQQLKNRIDLDFAYTNKKLFGTQEAVSIDLNVKNAKTLLVKVFHINAANYYRDYGREVNTDVNLDGLVANQEATHTYDDAPVRRVARHFEFDKLNKPGIYVIDFIGNGKSSRVLVRKGKLRHLVRTSTAGHVITVLDDKNKKLVDVTAYMAGTKYKADKDGAINVPFSNQPGYRPMIITGAGLTSLAQLSQQPENYQLRAGIYVDREALLNRKKAQVVVRPGLYLNGTPVSLKILEQVRLVIQSMDQDGVNTLKEVNDFKLNELRESVYEFQVPKRLRQISFALRAKVENMSQGGKKLDLAASQTFTLNEIDQSNKTEDLHFANYAGTYVVELLGKTGESRVSRSVQVRLKHRDFKTTVNVSLQTDVNGRVTLGALKDIDTVTATGPQGTSHTWRPPSDQHTYHAAVNGQAGESIQIAYTGSAKKAERPEISLLELRGNIFVADRFEHASVSDGFVNLGKLPRGNYDLLLKRSNTRIRIHVTQGQKQGGYVLGENRFLEVRNAKPLQIASVKTDKESISIQLQNVNKYTRVHVYATRYQPAYPVYAHLGVVRDPEPYLVTVPKFESSYIEGRNIGDEYRYILERKYAKKYPGNMLKRPSLLLNPWAIRSTETGQQQAKKGDSFGRKAPPKKPTSGRFAGKDGKVGSQREFANLDYLTAGSAVLLNLEPDEKGLVTIKREDLGAHQQIHVVAVDPRNTAYRVVALPEIKSKFNDLRLSNGLDPKKHFTEQKQITLTAKGGAFELPDITTSQFEAYDSLSRVYSLYATLNGNANLIEFSFILNWPKLKIDQKYVKYSKYACHELNFFLYKKDPKFFKQVVKPYLANKKDKTFMDKWLLGQDVSSYLKPWEHAQLNTVERILLAQQVKGEMQYTARHINDLYDLIPPNIDRYNQLFKTALKGRSLDADGGGWGYDEALKKADPKKTFEGKMRLGGKGGGGGGGSSLFSGGAPAPGASATPAPDNAPRDLAKALDAREADKVSEKQQGGKELRRSASKKSKAKNGANRAEAIEAEGADDAYFAKDADRRANVRQYYRKLDKTKEWVENNYYHLAIAQQNASLITVNSFWNDFARHDAAEPFYSTNFAEASRNFPEMMLALAVLDLPFEPGKHESKFDKAKMTLKPGSDMIVFHKQIQPAKQIAKKTPILVSQNFFRQGDRYKYIHNERMDKYVTEEFIVHTVYGCQTVITNPTSTPQKLDVLLQVPVGALPVLNGKMTRSVHMNLGAYNTRSLEYYFYFPIDGQYAHYPVHVAKNEQVVAFVPPVSLKVVLQPSNIDKESWDYISQFGSVDQVIGYMKANNLNRTNLNKIAWRMRDKAFFGQVVALLTQRHVYNHTLWSYGIKHNTLAPVRQYLAHAGGFINQVGTYIDAKPLTIDPVVRKLYEQMDYAPLVNARAHELGKRRQILNNRFYGQYHRLMKILSYKRNLDDHDRMAVTYYMLLQDRVDEAMDAFKQVNAQNLPTKLQYDYFTAYLDMYSDEQTIARNITDRYADYPVDRWRQHFKAVATQLDEIGGKDAQIVDKEDRTQKQTKLASTQGNFEFKVEAKKVTINYQNLEKVRVNYYKMDVELLFSRNPFVRGDSGRFAYIRPNATQTIALPKKQSKSTFDLPKQFLNSNVLVEIIADSADGQGSGLVKSQAYYSHVLALQVVENYGQIRVAHQGTNKPISRTYVKVYAQMRNGQIKFYKDGYTDLRGRFDYTSLNTNELDFVSKFSLLVYSDEHGAVVREATPPKR